MSAGTTATDPPNGPGAAPRAGGDTDVVQIESLNYDGRGVAHVARKTIFIDGALPGETVRFRYYNKRQKYDSGGAVEIITPSVERVEPACRYFGTCGGCSLQHMQARAQLSAKQQVLADNLRHIGRLEPVSWLAPIAGPEFGYRRRARLGVRLVPKKGGVLVGFRERRRSYITNLDGCLTLEPRVSDLLPHIRGVVARLSRPDRIPQIEVAVGDNAAALVFRHLESLTELDLTRLRAFGAEQDVQIFLQPGGLETVHALWPSSPPPLSYRLVEYGVTIEFAPTDFVQVNHAANHGLVHQAVSLLDPRPDDQVLDLFCGLGNFTFPLARRSRSVLGIEVDAGLLTRARRNAAINRIANVEFRQADLYLPRESSEPEASPWQGYRFDKLLLDPPRAGAMEAIKRLWPDRGPSRIVYVSCYPATLARDADYLVRALGYRLTAAGVVDMFPQTSHVESMAVFDKQ